MTRSLLNRLPDILAHAAVRSSEALHALGVRPGQSPMAWAYHRSDDASVQSRAAEASTRFQTGHDLALLLNSLIAGPQRPSLRRQVGFLWLRAAPSETVGDSRAAPAGTLGAHDLALSQAWLGDLALRLFVARELLAPSALLVLTPATGLGPCIPLMLKTVLGVEPVCVPNTAPDGPPTVLACRLSTTPHLRTVPLPRHQTPSLAQYLHDTPVTGRTAMVLRPGTSFQQLQPAWSGDWLLTDPDPAEIRALRSQLDRRAWALPPRVGSRGVQEPVAAWG